MSTEIECVEFAAEAPSTRSIRSVWLLIPLVLVIALAFYPVLGNGFVAFDDDDNLLENVEFRGFGWPQLGWAWSTLLLGVYQPAAWMLLEAEYVVWGLDPLGYH